VLAPPSFIARTAPLAASVRPRWPLASLCSRQRAPPAVAFSASALVCGDTLSGFEAVPTPAPLGATTSQSACCLLSISVASGCGRWRAGAAGRR
jgi:hypothetical protein